jgi:very-short-patch-repair endonuclease
MLLLAGVSVPLSKTTYMGNVQEHNKEIMYTAQYRAEEMQIFPSKLEERMRDFLDDHGVDYDFQKVFYIYEDDGWISRYYIADFYEPETCLIIEVDGKFHDKQKQHDKNRTKLIQEHYPEVDIYRWRWKDFDDEGKVNELLKRTSSL